MGLEREIANIRRRLNKIIPEVAPPKLKLHVIGPSEPVPAHSPWAMTIKIENKDHALSR